MTKKKTELLGMPWGTAAHRLRKSIMFALAKKLDLIICFRCGTSIDTVEEFSVEHKQTWQDAEDPAQAFFDLENIAFSHHACNCRAAARPYKKWASANERCAAWSRKNRTHRNAVREAWRQRRREAGLPVT